MKLQVNVLESQSGHRLRGFDNVTNVEVKQSTPHDLLTGILQPQDVKTYQYKICVQHMTCHYHV